MPDLINQAYIVSAHVQEAAPRGRWGVAEEKFTALCLPGMLPGFFMSYNHHGFAYCVNTISTGIPVTDKQTRKILMFKTPSVIDFLFVEQLGTSYAEHCSRSTTSLMWRKFWKIKDMGFLMVWVSTWFFARKSMTLLNGNSWSKLFVVGKKAFLYFITLKWRPLGLKIWNLEVTTLQQNRNSVF